MSEIKTLSSSEHHEEVGAVKPGDISDILGAIEPYGPNGIRGIVASPYVFGAACLASLGGFSFGYDQGVISIINVMDQFHAVFPQAKTAFGTGFMTGMLLLGAFVGCLFMPYLADKISRKRALTVVVVIFNLGAIIQTAAQNYGMLVAGRAIGGVGVGTLAMGAQLYISEISPPNLRGTLLVLESISIVSGVCIAYWLTFATRSMGGESSFRLPLGLQMLALVNRQEECLSSLVKLRGLPLSDARVQTEYKSIIAEVEFQKAVQERKHPGVQGIKLETLLWLDLFDRKMWRRTAVGCGVCFFQQFSGINAFIYYAPTLFRSIGQSDEMSLVLSGIFNLLQLVAVVVCFVVIDKVGRRPLAIVGGFGTAIAHIIIAVLAGIYSRDWADNPAAGWAGVAMAFAFILVYGVSYSPLDWALPPEVFSMLLDPRVSLSLHVLTGYPILLSVLLHLLRLLTLASVPTYSLRLCVDWPAYGQHSLSPRLKAGRTLEQMDDVFGDTSGQEERL